jgi:hypothetical protein
MATGKSEIGRKWAPLVGLIGQPAWLLFGYQQQAWGLLLISSAYTLVYVRGVWVQFRKPRRPIVMTVEHARRVYYASKKRFDLRALTEQLKDSPEIFGKNPKWRPPRS